MEEGDGMEEETEEETGWDGGEGGEDSSPLLYGQRYALV